MPLSYAEGEQLCSFDRGRTLWNRSAPHTDSLRGNWTDCGSAQIEIMCERWTLPQLSATLFHPVQRHQSPMEKSGMNIHVSMSITKHRERGCAWGEIVVRAERGPEEKYLTEEMHKRLPKWNPEIDVQLYRAWKKWKEKEKTREKEGKSEQEDRLWDTMSNRKTRLFYGNS